jgi:hypothetical protein
MGWARPTADRKKNKDNGKDGFLGNRRFHFSAPPIECVMISYSRRNLPFHKQTIISGELIGKVVSHSDSFGSVLFQDVRLRIPEICKGVLNCDFESDIIYMQ